MKEKISNWLESMTKDKHEKIALEKYTKKITEYIQMTQDEFDMKYTEQKVRYEAGLRKLTFIAGAFIITIISGVWKYFFMAAAKIMGVQLANTGYPEEVYSEVAGIMLLIGLIFLALIIFYVSSILKAINEAYREKCYMESALERRKGGKR